MEQLILARHALTDLNEGGIVNGDPAQSTALTERGRAEARALGGAVGAVDLVTHTSFARTRATAELAWPGTPLLAIPELDEISFGQFEGTAFAEGYAAWAWSTGPLAECPGGGESRAAALARYCRGYRHLLTRPEAVVAHVGHGAPIRYLIDAIHGATPAQRLERVPHGVPYRVSVSDLERAVTVLDAWLREPAWA